MIKRLVLALVVLGLLAASVSIVAARVFPQHPYDFQAGIREEGRYTMVVPRTYGRLIPMPSFSNGGGMVSTQAGGCGSMTPSAPTIGSGGGRSNNSSSPVADVPIRPAGMISKSAESGLSLGNFLTTSGSGSNDADHLENDLRDIMHTLNSK